MVNKKLVLCLVVLLVVFVLVFFYRLFLKSDDVVFLPAPPVEEVAVGNGGVSQVDSLVSPVGQLSEPAVDVGGVVKVVPWSLGERVQGHDFAIDIDIDRSVFDSVDVGDKLLIPLPTIVRRFSVITAVEFFDNGDKAIRGFIEGFEKVHSFVYTQGETEAYGTITSPEGNFFIFSQGGQSVLIANPPGAFTSESDVILDE